jgi:hypothetical protein
MQAEHCAARAQAEERERELLDDAATARHELQLAQEAAAEEKRRQQRHLRRAQVHTEQPRTPARPHARTPARPHARTPTLLRPLIAGPRVAAERRARRDQAQ